MITMKKLLLQFVTFVTLLQTSGAVPDEGMWIPVLIEKYNMSIGKHKHFDYIVGKYLP